MKGILDQASRLRAVALAGLTLCTATPLLAVTTPDFVTQPLAFVANDGQLPEAVLFNARTPQADVFLTREGAVLSLQGQDRHATLRISLVGSHGSEALVAKEPLAGKINMFLGSDPAGWRTNIPTYARVLAPGVLPGVDAVYYGNGRSLEFDFVVAPGVDAGALRLRLDGADRLAVNAAGDLVVTIAGGSVELQAPVVYQDGAEGRTPVEGRYVVKGKDEVAFELCGRDPARTVVIDPVITYSTYLGGATQDSCRGIAAGPGGSFYVAGQTTSNPFPGVGNVARTGDNTVLGAYGGGTEDGFVTKFNADGTLAWSAYLGGTGTDRGSGVAVDAAGNAYVGGYTNSTNFPLSSFPYQPALGGTLGAYDAFLAELSSDGSQLLYSTYFGGSADERSSWVRLYSPPGEGAPLRVYVSGYTTSTDLPTTVNAYDRSANGDVDSYLAIFTPSVGGTGSLVYATYFGGAGREDMDGGLAVDTAGNAYLGGLTNSTASTFPTTLGAWDNTLNGPNDAFVAKINPAVSGAAGLVYCTYLGGSAEEGTGGGQHVDVNENFEVFIVGWTRSADFPTTSNAYDRSLNPKVRGTPPLDAFVTRLNPQASTRVGQLVYSTFLGGVSSDSPEGVAVVPGTNRGIVLVTGTTQSIGFPTQGSDADTSYNGGGDAFLTELDTSASSGPASLVYSSYVGGSGSDGGHAVAVGPTGEWFVTGTTTSSGPPHAPGTSGTGFPVTANAFQLTNAGSYDGFVMRLTP